MSGLSCGLEVLCQYNLLSFQIREKVEEKIISVNLKKMSVYITLAPWFLQL